MLRKRNPRFFTFRALINTASSYGGTNVGLQVFFGVAVTVPTMLSKLNTRYPPQQITEKTMRTLRDEGSCGLCVKYLKFQRGGHSSETSLTTSRLCVRLTVPR